MNEHLVQLTDQYINDEKSYREFSYYINEHTDFARVHMNNLAIKYQLKNHYQAAATALGEHRVTIYRATKK